MYVYFLVCCNKCCRDFPSYNFLEIHHKKHHYIRQCPNCNKTFRHTKKYVKHLRSHLNNCPYQCKICLDRFNKKGDLNNHVKEHDNLEKRICRACCLKCDDHSSLTRHLTTHGEPPYKCFDCVSRFSRLVDRNTHVQNHILRCELCRIPMKFRDDLLYHINEEHLTNKRDPAPVLVGPLFEYPDMVSIGECRSNDSMAETSSSDDESDTAESSSLDEKSDIAESSSSVDKSDSSLIREASADIDYIYKTKHDDKFICFICLQLCPSSKLLKYHMKAHNWCPCPYCPKFFVYLQDLEMHKKENHYDQCTLCEATFQPESDLNLLMPKCRLYSDIKLKLNKVVQAFLGNKKSDRHEELCRKLKKVEKDLGGDCKINFAFKMSTNCLENFCEDRDGESFIHYHFPHDLVLDVNLSNSVRDHEEDLFNLSDALLQSKNNVMKNLPSYSGFCVRFLTEIPIFKIITFVEEAKKLKFPLELHVVEQLMFFKEIIEDACKLPISEEMPEDIKDYLTHVNCYLSRISRKHLISKCYS
ncbi:zinc finger protein 569 [Trichonephila inaurata madagascariensis]|uniref:Zinc finger protein 569 n=1 Tax=Trichonephila inaurata madagascariensis TaxID=2747483 RepID=A0A8X6WNR2_9ARAC|nr:zinc finger protein 569 [Trichonephila inaurata madagascariensis]